jgi:hypothetical protein
MVSMTDWNEKARELARRFGIRTEDGQKEGLPGSLIDAIAHALEQAYTQGLEAAANMLENSAATLAGISLAASSKEQEARFEAAQFALRHSAEDIRALKPGREG